MPPIQLLSRARESLHVGLSHFFEESAAASEKIELPLGLRLGLARRLGLLLRLLLFMDNGAWPASILPSKPRLQSGRLSFKFLGVSEDSFPVSVGDGARQASGASCHGSKLSDLLD